MLRVSTALCAGGLLCELLLILAVRTFATGEWRSHIPGKVNLFTSILSVLPHYASVVSQQQYYRLIIGPAVWAAIMAITVATNSVMVACALGIGGSAFHTEVRTVLLGFVCLAYVLVAVGWGMVWTSITPEKRKTFFRNGQYGSSNTHAHHKSYHHQIAHPSNPYHYHHHSLTESLKQYLDREWETRTASRVGWGDNLNAARAHVVVTWSHVYWPKEKVRTWLNENWRSWQRHPPKWFDAKVCAYQRR